MLVIASAVPEEQAYLSGRRPPRPHGRPRTDCVSGVNVLRATCGMGRERTAAALERLIRELPVERLLFLGFAGGVDPDLPAGAVVQVIRVVAEDGRVLSVAGDAAGEAAIPADVPPVTVAAVSQLAATRADKALLYQRLKCLSVVAVDMESATVASTAAAHGIPCLILRAISDPADSDLPRPLRQVVSPTGALRFAPMIRSCLRRPAGIGEMLRFHADVRRAARALAKTARAVVRHSATPPPPGLDP